MCCHMCTDRHLSIAHVIFHAGNRNLFVVRPFGTCSSTLSFFFPLYCTSSAALGPGLSRGGFDD